jgi:hypothetical protein
MSNKQARFERRLEERRAQRAADEGVVVPAQAEAPEIERRSGEDRRVRSMSPAEVDDWLKRNGISGGDRRKGDRRHR